MIHQLDLGSNNAENVGVGVAGAGVLAGHLQRTVANAIQEAPDLYSDPRDYGC